jgi:hypothetical protein
MSKDIHRNTTANNIRHDSPGFNRLESSVEVNLMRRGTLRCSKTDDRDGDAPPAIALTRTDYVLETKLVSFSHWVTKYGRAQPAFEPDPNGKALLVTKASKQVATEEWWRALSNDKAWNAAAQ